MLPGDAAEVDADPDWGRKRHSIICCRTVGGTGYECGVR